MGRIFTIQFDQTPDSQFYVCRSCKTHIALLQEVITSYQYLETKIHLVRNAVNLVIDSPEHHYKPPGGITFAKVYCVACNMRLGQKIVQVHTYTNLFVEGRVEIKRKKVLLWDGHQMLDAITLLPHENHVNNQAIDE